MLSGIILGNGQILQKKRPELAARGGAHPAEPYRIPSSSVQLGTHITVGASRHTLVKVPTPVPEPPHPADPPPPDLGGKHRPKPVPPEAHRLVANIDPPLEQQILNVAQRQRVADVQHYRRADHVRRRVETPERALIQIIAKAECASYFGTVCSSRLLARRHGQCGVGSGLSVSRRKGWKAARIQFGRVSRSRSRARRAYGSVANLTLLCLPN